MNTTTTSPTLTITDRLRRWSYLQDVELWLDPMPGRRRREVLRELRADLGEAAADVGMARAIDDLGGARTLARAYVDAEPVRRPSWVRGVLGVGAVLLVAEVGLIAYMFGMSDALLGSGGGSTEGDYLGVRVLTTATEAEMSWEMSGWSWPIMIAAALAFAVCSASWRLLTRPATHA
jgi:hypothetical protein